MREDESVSRYIDAKVMEQRVREAMVNSPYMIPPLINFYFGGCNEVCINDGNSCTDAMCREGMRAWLRKKVEG